MFGFYNSWVGGEELSLGTVLFYYLMPIGAAIPFAWSYHTERKSGYLKNIASRTDKKKYFIAKTIAVFVSGVLAVLIPLIVNIALVSAFVPTIEPFAGYTFYNHVFIGDMWIELYYTCPWLYVTLYVLLDVLYGVIYALLIFAVTFFIKNILAILFVPFISLFVIGYFGEIIIMNVQMDRWFEFNPIIYLHSLHSGNQRAWWIILLITIGLLCFSLCTIFIRGFKDEIF